VAFRARRQPRDASRFESRAQLAALSPEQFERWCAERLKVAGYQVNNVGGQGDHGVDLIAERDAIVTVVQCKRYAGARQVGEPQVRDLFGAMHHFGASRAMIITAGTFTSQAKAWIIGKPIDLWDVDRLGAFTSAPAVVPASTPSVSVGPCDHCGSSMQVRTNRTTREQFYGCSAYPRCRFTRPFAP
jgi:restriction system protein